MKPFTIQVMELGKIYTYSDRCIVRAKELIFSSPAKVAVSAGEKSPSLGECEFFYDNDILCARIYPWGNALETLLSQNQKFYLIPFGVSLDKEENFSTRIRIDGLNIFYGQHLHDFISVNEQLEFQAIESALE